MAVQKEPEPADALRIAETEHRVDRGEVALLDDVTHERLAALHGFVV